MGSHVYSIRLATAVGTLAGRPQGSPLHLFGLCNELRGEFGGVECAPAGCHIVAVRDGISAAVEAQLIIVRWCAGIARGCDVVEGAVIVRATADLVKGGVEETKLAFALFCSLFVSKDDHGSPHGGSSRSAANGEPASARSSQSATAAVACAACRAVHRITSGRIGV